MTIKKMLHVNVPILIMAMAFLSIISVSLFMRISKPAITVFAGANISSQKLPNSAMNENADEMATIGKLMRQVSEHPGDTRIIIKLVENLLAVGQWQAAENFAQKGLALNPKGEENEKLLYMLALAHHNKGEHESAADLLEKLLASFNNPSAHYSLGILYVHYLNKPQEGLKEFKKALENPNLSPSLHNAILEELEKENRKATIPAQ